MNGSTMLGYACIVMIDLSLLTISAGSWDSQSKMLEKNPPTLRKWKDTILLEKYLMICGKQHRNWYEERRKSLLIVAKVSKCKKCGKAIAEPKELIRMGNGRK